MLVRSRAPSVLLLGVALLSTARLAGSDPDAASDPFPAAVARYEDYLRRPSFFLRTRGRILLARTRDARAVPLLARDYRAPEHPIEPVRQLIPTLVRQHLGADPSVLDALAEWRTRSSTAADVWLWHQTLWMDARAGREGAWEAWRPGKRDLLLRAAALRALAAAQHPQALQAVAEALARPEGKGILRCVLPEAAAAALHDLHAAPTDEAAYPLLAQAIRLLGDKSLPERTGLVLRRHLTTLLGCDDMGPGPTAWLAALEAARAGAPPKAAGDGSTTAQPRFFDVTASGKRIAYVIDGSSSMMAPLEENELNDLRRPVTPREGDPRPRRGRQPDLPWHRIRTRWDTAREMLKLSLRELPPKTSFCVILFGSQADPLAATPGFVAAVPEKVEAACQELDAVQGGPATDTNPHGTLLGGTNMHGGLWRAFALGGAVPGAYPEAPSAAVLESGCDAIYILSDGAPNEDDWREDDAPDPTGDGQGLGPALAARTRKPPPFPGPFNDHDLLVEDVRRMNLLRHAEIHAIAIGRADRGVLRRLADLGLGKVRVVGGGS